MKKIIILTAVIIFIPFFIIIIFDNFKLEELQLKRITNTIVRVKRQNLDIIENVYLEEYVVGVLAGEMPIYFEIEALKAQAVAARTYVLKRLDYNKNEEYDVVDSTTNQVYLDNEYLKNAWKNNYTKNINKLRTAVNETIGEYLAYNDEMIDALFFSTSNGYTENSELVFGFELPYLRSVKSDWDKETSSAFSTQKQISLQEFYEKLNLQYNDKLTVEVLDRSITNRINSIKINGTTFKGRDLYNKLTLRSADFELTQVGTNVLISTKGYGHGVGMSQYGALGMAGEGYNYKEILTYYYTGTTIKNLEN